MERANSKLEEDDDDEEGNDVYSYAGGGIEDKGA